jgi:hypothetical protein
MHSNTVITDIDLPTLYGLFFFLSLASNTVDVPPFHTSSLLSLLPVNPVASIERRSLILLLSHVKIMSLPVGRKIDLHSVPLIYRYDIFEHSIHNSIRAIGSDSILQRGGNCYSNIQSFDSQIFKPLPLRTTKSTISTCMSTLTQPIL